MTGPLIAAPFFDTRCGETGLCLAQDLGIKTLFWQKYGYFVNSLNAGNFLPNVIDIAFTMCYNSVTLRAESDASGAAQKQEIML